MRSELAAQREKLEEELANLDALLAADTDYAQFTTVDARRSAAGSSVSAELEAEWQALRTKLSGNRIFGARERIVDAITLICEELDRESDRPVTIETPREPTNDRPEEDLETRSAEVVQKSKTDETVIDDDAMVETAQPDEKARILADSRNTVRAHTKAAIRTSPPGGIAPLPEDSAPGHDDLTLIHNIRPDLAQDLVALGVRRYRQIANWSESDVASVRAALGLGRRITQENWIEQAAALDARLLAVTPSTTREEAIQPDQVEKTEPEMRAAASPVAVAAASIAARVRKTADLDAPDTSTDRAAVDVTPDETPASEPIEFDHLIRIRGIDAELAQRLASAGPLTFSDIADWTDADVKSVSSEFDLGDRIVRESWIEQAAILAAGGMTSYSAHIERGEPVRAGALIDWDAGLEAGGADSLARRLADQVDSTAAPGVMPPVERTHSLPPRVADPEAKARLRPMISNSLSERLRTMGARGESSAGPLTRKLTGETEQIPSQPPPLDDQQVPAENEAAASELAPHVVPSVAWGEEAEVVITADTSEPATNDDPVTPPVDDGTQPPPLETETDEVPIEDVTDVLEATVDVRAPAAEAASDAGAPVHASNTDDADGADDHPEDPEGSWTGDPEDLEAEVEIVTHVSRDPSATDVLPNGGRRAQADEQVHRPPPLPQETDSFDADHHAGYHRDVGEASVSIISADDRDTDVRRTERTVVRRGGRKPHA